MTIAYAELPLQIPRGSRYVLALQPTTTERGYRPVTQVEKAAPVRLTVAAHGLPNGWTVKPIGTGDSPLLRLGEQIVTVVNADTLEFNAIHSLDWPDYGGGVQLAYLKPLSLAGYTARFEVRRTLTDDAPLFPPLTETAGIAIADGTLQVSLSAQHSTDLGNQTSFYHLTVRAPGSDQDELLAYGAITVLPWGPSE